MVAAVQVVKHAASVWQAGMNADFVETRYNMRHSGAGSVLSHPAQQIHFSYIDFTLDTYALTAENILQP